MLYNSEWFFNLLWINVNTSPVCSLNDWLGNATIIIQLILEQ